MDKVESNIEIEYKFWADKLSKKTFHAKIENMTGSLKEPFYVCSCDDYYIGKKEGSFLRYRKGGGETELTLKVKKDGNVVRKEINLSLNNNDDSAIVEFLNLSGYIKEFSVFKEAWIWQFEDCDVSYYTLSDGRSVVEIEATKYNTPKEGVKIINSWREKLDLGVLTQEFRSLFEIFTEEKNEKHKLGKIDW
jgi:adenylate cyclase class IV